MIAWNEVLQYIHDVHINHRRTYSESNGFQVAIQDGIKTDAYLLVVLLSPVIAQCLLQGEVGQLLSATAEEGELKGDLNRRQRYKKKNWEIAEDCVIQLQKQSKLTQKFSTTRTLPDFDIDGVQQILSSSAGNAEYILCKHEKTRASSNCNCTPISG